MRSKSDKRWALAGHIVMIVLSLLAIIPFVFLIIASFTSESAALRNGYSFFPEAWSLEAYKFIFQQKVMIGRAYAVTLLVTVVGTVAGIAITSMLGFVVSRRDLPGRSIILFVLVFAMLFRGGLTATYIVYTRVFNFKNTIFALIVPNLLLSIYNVQLFRNYYENSNLNALIEAAHIDGASEVRTFFKIIFPLSMPMVASIGLMQALTYWNNWQNGLYYLSTTSKLQTIQTILNNINENIKFLQQNNLGSTVTAGELPSATVRMAIAVVGILPILCLYPFFQKYFVRGMTAGAVKE